MESGKPAKFTLIIQEAKLFRDTATFGKMDPFVHIFFNDKEIKTRIAKDGGQNPKWEEIFEIQPLREGDEFEVKLFDDCFTGSDPIGMCKIKLS